MIRRSGRLYPLICLCLASIFLVSGCAVAGSTRPVVKIGLVAPFEGLHRNLGYEVLYAVKLAVRQYNADTGTGGPLVELVALDDTLDPGHAVEQARELTLDPDVVGVVGHLSRSTTAAALPEYERAGLPLIVPVAMPQRQSDAGRADSEDRRPSPVRLMAAAEEVQGAIAARFAVDTLKARHLVVVEGGEDTLARSFSAEAESRGAEVLHVNWPDEVDRHTIDLISMLLRDPPGAIFFAEGPVAGAEFLLGARAAGLAAPVVGSSAWGDPTFASLVADNVWGRLSSLPRRQTGKSAPHSKLGLTFYTAPCPDLNDAPAGRQFVQGYAAYVGQKPGRQAALAYDAARFLLEAIARASRDGRVPTREMVVSRLLEITVYSGAAGQYRFDGKGEQVQAPLPVVVAVATD